MNKYNIKVGDYVETWNGDIGYVTNIDSDYFYVKLIINKGKKSIHIMTNVFIHLNMRKQFQEILEESE